MPPTEPARWHPQIFLVENRFVHLGETHSLAGKITYGGNDDESLAKAFVTTKSCPGVQDRRTVAHFKKNTYQTNKNCTHHTDLFNHCVDICFDFSLHQGGQPQPSTLSNGSRAQWYAGRKLLCAEHRWIYTYINIWVRTSWDSQSESESESS